MAIVTLLTDCGKSDHYASAIKAAILRVNPGLNIVDLSHEVAPCDIAHGAFLLRAVFRDFPKGSVHLAAVDAIGNPGDPFIALQLEDHFFVGVDNGLFGLVSNQAHQHAVELHDLGLASSVFPEKDILAPASAKLASGVSITDLGKSIPSIKKKTDRQAKATRKQIAGHVIRVDHYGNLITNIAQRDFDILSKGKKFTLQFGGEKFKRIHTTYNQADQGECFLIFNSLGLLEIGIYKGRASELLGLSYDSPVHITFEE